MKSLHKILLFSSLLFSFSAQAQVGDNAQEISVFASSCEQLINGESRSSARIRAVDKASFKAVEEIPELSDYRSNLTTHEFNLKVYRLVDNYLEDIKIDSSTREDGAVCVNISAYIPSTAITEIFAKDVKSQQALELEDTDITDDISITIPPKPNIVINQEIAYQDEENEQNISTAKSQDLGSNNKIRLFIDKTEFYNNTSTNGFFAYLEQAFSIRPDIQVIADLTDPDYILKTKVLKARVDNINSQTSRMQIVVALELTDTVSSETITEHQNRFVLFSSAEEDAQKVASDLTRKLFSAGVDKLISKIKSSSKSNSGSVITPH